MKKLSALKLSPWKKAFLTLTILYSFYLIKSGLGINISHEYHLTDVFTRPKAVVKAAVHRFSRDQVALPPSLIHHLNDRLL